MADEPDWLKSSSANRPASAASPSDSAVAAAGDGSPPPPYKNTVKYTILFLNMGFMVFMAATGALGIAAADDVNDTGVIFVGIYLLLFAAIEFIFEVAQLMPGSALEVSVKKNFGFLYGTIGKGVFLLFMGILAFGLDPSSERSRNMALACGVLVSAWGIVQVLAYLKFPKYFDKLDKYQP